MKAYPKYKSSGIDWLGEIPSHWRCVKIKNVVSCNDEVLSENTDKDRQIEYVEISDVTYEKGITGSSKFLFKDAPSRARRITQKGDVIISTVRTYLKAIARIADTNPIVSTGFAVIRPLGVEPSFLFYAISSNGFLNEVQKYSTGVSYPAITSQELINLRCTLPPFEEQEAIAGYLDEVTGKVDALITEKRAQVADLCKYRKSLITEAVTKGLNTDAPTRSSGIDWLGDIPKHWKEVKLKYVSEIQTGSTPSTCIDKYWDNPTKDWFTPGDFTSFRLEDSNRKLSETAFVEKACRIFPKNTVLLVGIGATLGKTGITTVECSANQQINAIIFNHEVLPLFGAYLLSICRTQLNSIANAATLPILNQEQTKSFQIPLPPLSEQQQIADFLDEKTAMIDELIAELEAQISDLATYRQAVITEAVTGKIDVREWSNPSKN